MIKISVAVFKRLVYNFNLSDSYIVMWLAIDTETQAVKSMISSNVWIVHVVFNSLTEQSY